MILKLSKQSRLEPKAPHQKRRWAIHGVSELLGTFLISFFYVAFSLYVKEIDDGHGHHSLVAVERFLGHPVIVAFLEASFKGLLIIIFLRWSVDINPAVSIYKILTGYNKAWYGLFKVALQMLGGFLAGAFVLAFANDHFHHVNHSLGTEGLTKTIFNADEHHLFQGGGSASMAGIMIFAFEMLITAIYLFPIFTKNLTNHYRELLLLVVLFLNTSMSFTMFGMSGAANPARAFSLWVPNALLGKADSAMDSAMLLAMFGSFAGPLFYIGLQEVSDKLINPSFHSAIKYKNRRVAHISRSVVTKNLKYETFKKHSKLYRLKDGDPRFDEYLNYEK